MSLSTAATRQLREKSSTRVPSRRSRSRPAAWLSDPAAVAAFNRMSRLSAFDPECRVAMAEWNRLAWAADKRAKGE